MFLSRLAAAVIAVGLLSQPTLAATTFADTARAFITDKGNQAIQTFGVKDRNERYARFRSLLNESFALKGIARFIIGRHWTAASPDQQARYLRQFEDYVVANYAASAWNIEGVNLTVDTVKPIKPGEVMVNTLIHIPHKSDKPVALGFRVRESSHGPKIVDLMVDGISLVISHRSEFNSVLGQHKGDFDAFLAFLGDRTRKLEETAAKVAAKTATR